jgi:hypothetical protein
LGKWQWFWWEDLRESNHLEDLCTNGRIIKPDLQEVAQGGIEWVYLAQDRER